METDEIVKQASLKPYADPLFHQIQRLLALARSRRFLPEARWPVDREMEFYRQVKRRVDRTTAQHPLPGAGSVLQYMATVIYSERVRDPDWAATVLAILGILESIEYSEAVSPKSMLWAGSSIYSRQFRSDRDDEELIIAMAEDTMQYLDAPTGEEQQESLAEYAMACLLRKKLQECEACFPTFKELLLSLPPAMIPTRDPRPGTNTPNLEWMKRVYALLRRHYMQHGCVPEFPEVIRAFNLDLAGCEYPLSFYIWVKTRELYETIAGASRKEFEVIEAEESVTRERN